MRVTRITALVGGIKWYPHCNEKVHAIVVFLKMPAWIGTRLENELKSRFCKLLPVLLCCISLSCAGCGITAGSSKTEEGMKSLEELDYNGALTDFSAAVENGENKRSAYRGMGIAYDNLAQYDKAVDSFLTALQAGSGIADSMDYDINYYLAGVYIKQENYEDARSVYDSILNLKPNEVNARFLRGVCELENGDHDLASTDFSQVMTENPNDYDRFIMIYKALADNGYEDEGTAILQGAMKTGSSTMNNYEKGQISYYLGNNADAQNYLEKARNEKSSADETNIILLLGQTGEKQGDYNYAINVYREYLDKENNHAEIYNRLGLCEMQAGDYKNAIADFENGMALNDTKVNQALKRNEIIAYEYSGDFDSAASKAAEYIAAYPDDKDMQREVIFLSTRSDILASLIPSDSSGSSSSDGSISGSSASGSSSSDGSVSGSNVSDSSSSGSDMTGGNVSDSSSSGSDMTGGNVSDSSLSAGNMSGDSTSAKTAAKAWLKGMSGSSVSSGSVSGKAAATGAAGFVSGKSAAAGASVSKGVAGSAGSTAVNSSLGTAFNSNDAAFAASHMDDPR